MKLDSTPGPWEIRNGFENYICDSDDYAICVGPYGGDIGEADARLIAVAPEMLEALIAVYRYGTYSSTDWSGVLGVIEAATGKTWDELNDRT